MTRPERGALPFPLMAALAWITGLVLTVGYLIAGGMKLIGNDAAIEMANRLGYENLRQGIGVAEIAGAMGVFIGIVSEDRGLEWFGFFAAFGLIVTMIGAIQYHRQAGDGPKEWAPAAVLAAMSVLYIVAISQRD